MLLANKNAVIYGAGGAIGAAVAHAFAREGANVFLTGRNLAALEVAAKEITAADETAETARVDALDEQAVERHADAVVAKAGSLDISFNAIGIPQKGIQGTPLVELPAAGFGLPVATYTTAHFLTARAAARRMLTQGSGVILTLTATPARLAAPLPDAGDRIRLLPSDAADRPPPSAAASPPMPQHPTQPRYPGVQVRLSGEDGNAFAILGRTTAALRAARVPSEEIDAYFAEATSGDYDHLLQTTMRWVDWE
jgi:NAD(P)-dependent dehydrogenase (short-subunit alcohol dehydrogenase family)